MNRFLKGIIFVMVLILTGLVGLYVNQANAATVVPKATIAVSNYDPPLSARWHDFNFRSNVFTCGYVKNGDWFSDGCVGEETTIGFLTPFDKFIIEIERVGDNCHPVHGCAHLQIAVSATAIEGKPQPEFFWNSQGKYVEKKRLVVTSSDNYRRNPDGSYVLAPVSRLFMSFKLTNFHYTPGIGKPDTFKIGAIKWGESFTTGRNNLATAMVAETSDLAPSAVPIPAGGYLLGTAIFWIGWFKNRKKKHYKIAGW